MTMTMTMMMMMMMVMTFCQFCQLNPPFLLVDWCIHISRVGSRLPLLSGRLDEVEFNSLVHAAAKQGR